MRSPSSAPVSPLTLFHVSEEAGIERFEPRPAADGGQPVVWAIDDDHLRNYLVPRDCPRVTFYAGSGTTDADVARFLGSSAAVIAIEEAWVERVRACRLYCYRMPIETFHSIDACAGYFVSRVPVVPAGVQVMTDPLAELARRGVELRILASLWPLRDAVIASSLQFSIIRMRNAASRVAATAGDQQDDPSADGHDADDRRQR
jgi:hypothetical protein